MLSLWVAEIAGAGPESAGPVDLRPADVRAVAVAVAAVADRAYDVEVDKVVRRPTGTRVVLVPEIDGIPVDGAVVVRLDPDGSVVEVHDSHPDTVVHGAVLAAPQVTEVAARVLPGGVPRLRLSWQTVGDELRQVWTVELDRVPVRPGDLLVPRIRIDGLTGRVISVTDGATTEDPPSPRPLAAVYHDDPGIDGKPSVVELPPQVRGLSDDRVEVHACRDLGELVDGWFPDAIRPLHVCSRRDAEGPVGGDFLFAPIPWPVDPARDEDDFAAPHVMWNVHRALDWLDGLGWTPISGFDPRLVVTVNYRGTDAWSAETLSEPSAALAPYDNAYASGGWEDYYGEWHPPELVFGQGSRADFAYSADVIHHELAHIVVKSQAGPDAYLDTDWGPSLRAPALNEGLADYFSAAFHGDPLVAEYIGATDGASAIRDLDGTDSCATDLVGEPHYDSVPFSQALWQLRVQLAPSEQSLLDVAVLDSLSLMGPFADFPQAVDAIGAMVEESLGAARAGELDAAFDAHGVRDCPPIRPAVPGSEPFLDYALVLGASPWSVHGELPGFLQFPTTVPEGGADLVLRFTQTEWLGIDLYGDNRPKHLHVIGRSGERLTWSQEPVVDTLEFDGYSFDVEVMDWRSDGDDVGESVELGERPYVDPDGNVDERYLLHDYEVRWRVDDGGPYVFQLANRTERYTVAYDLALEVTPLADPDLTGPDPTDRPDDPAGDGSTGPVADGRGCGCAVGGSPSGLVLTCLGFALARRRRR